MEISDPVFDEIVKKPLKFKKENKKQKTKKVSKSKIEEATKEKKDKEGEETNEQKSSVAIVKTKAEKEYEIFRNARARQRVSQMADKTHRERVEEFNQYLDSLSEHYDIQKVSWTK